MKHLVATISAIALLPLVACHHDGPGTSSDMQGASPRFTPEPKKGGPVVASFDGDTLTADEVTAKLNEKSPFERQRFTTLERKKEFVENMVRFDLLAKEAARRGLDHDAEVVHAAETVMVRKLIQQEIDDNPAKKNISDDELKTYYQAHIDDFVRPEMIRLSLIQLAAPSKAAAEKRRGDADKLLAELKGREKDYAAFGLLARNKSEDMSKVSDGDLRFLSKQQIADKYGEEVANAGTALTAVGQLSPPVITDKGLYLLKLSGRTPALNQPFEQVKPQLQSRLWYERRSKLYDSFVEDLKKKSGYSLDEKALDGVQVSASVPSVAGMQVPGGPHGLPPPGMHSPPGPNGARPPLAGQVGTIKPAVDKGEAPPPTAAVQRPGPGSK